MAGRQTTWEPRSGSRFFVGSDWQGSTPAEALVDEVRIFDRRLTAGQVRRVMEGLAIPAVRATGLRAPKEIVPGEAFEVTFSGEGHTEASAVEPMAMLDGAALVRVSPRSPGRVMPRANPAKHLIVFTKIPSNDPGEKRDWEQAAVDLLDLQRYHGYDPALYEGEEGIVLSRVIGVDGDRCWSEPWNKLFFFQPELSGFFRSGDLSGVELYYIYWELPSHPRGFRVGPGYPVGRAYYDPLTHALRLQNPGHVTFYNWFRGTMGHEQDLREFCRAFRGLPMTEPALFSGRVLPKEAASDERLWVRQFGERVAVVNDSPEPRRVDLRLPRGYAPRGLRDLALDVTCEVGDSAGERAVVLDLRPWDFRTLAPD